MNASLPTFALRSRHVVTSSGVREAVVVIEGGEIGLVPGNADQMAPLCDAGALGIKAFLCHSGLKEFPYDGFELQGRVQRTYLRGNLVFSEGVHRGHPAGELISHPRSKGNG